MRVTFDHASSLIVAGERGEGPGNLALNVTGFRVSVTKRDVFVARCQAQSREIAQAILFCRPELLESDDYTGWNGSCTHLGGRSYRVTKK